jgi:hypothetical protein
LKANSWSGKKALVIAATLVLVLSAGLAMVAEDKAMPSTSAPATSSAASTATATVTNAATKATETDPHLGTIDAYLNEPNGANTVDPAVSYYTVDYEPIMNVFETLVNYNGSSTSSFIPTVATCVPGTLQCTTDYGSSSIPGFTGIFNSAGAVFTGGNGLPTYWTFVIDPAAHFYNATHGVGWSVYPSDVMFSIARTLAFTDPFGAGPGWIIGQSLLPATNQGLLCTGNSPVCWDSVHSPFNNTPYDVLSSMLINDSNYCPSSAMGALGNGCITFVADSGALGVADWPEFLDFVADNLGASIEPCGLYTALGAGLPGFPGTHAANGDGSCKLPGGGTSTSGPAFQGYLTSVGPATLGNDTGSHGVYGWDTLENRTWTNFPGVQPSVQNVLAGSGPYYGTINLATGYGLRASPVYEQPSACGGDPSQFAQYSGPTSYCDPAPGHFIGNVSVTFETGDAAGLAAYEAGTSDWSDILTNHFSTMLQLQSEGKLNILNTPSLSVFQQDYVMNWNPTVRGNLGFTGTNNIPDNFFAWEAARGLLQASYPFASIESNVWTSEGLQSLLPVGGQIPNGMACYYAPTTTNGCTNSYAVDFAYMHNGGVVDTNAADVGSAAWWWTQGRNPSSPYYDPQLANCTTGSPCEFTIEGSTGAPPQDAANTLWANSISSVTGGAVQPNLADISAEDLLDDCGIVQSGTNPCPIFNFGWIPDYPDPTDYEGAYGVPNGTYTNPNADNVILQSPVFYNAASCTHPTNMAKSYKQNLEAAVYWANESNATAIANDCQGVAYNAFLWLINTAAPLAAGSQRILLYDLSQSIMSALNFYTWTGQQNVYFTAAPWIAVSSINTNVLIGTGDDQFWFQMKYATAVHTTNETFKESGLPKDTIWNVIVNGQTFSSSGKTLVVPLQTGTYSYKLIGTNDYSPATPTGTLTVTSSPATIKAKYVNAGSTVTFKEKGLAKGTKWQVTVLDVNYTSTSTKISLRLPSGTFGYAVTPVAPNVSAVPGYKLTLGGSGSVTTAPPKNLNVKVDFSAYNPYGATFTAHGLPSEKWTVHLKLTKGTGLLAPKPGAMKSLTNASISWTDLANGTYTYTVSAKGFTASAGSFVINGGSAAVTVNFTAKAKPSFVGAAPAPALMPASPIAAAATPSRAEE